MTHARTTADPQPAVTTAPVPPAGPRLHLCEAGEPTPGALDGVRVLLLQAARGEGRVARLLVESGARLARADVAVLEHVTVRDDATDLVVVDGSEPAIDGVAAIAALRAAGVSVALLLLLRREEIAREVQALAAGADDVLTCGAHPSLLVARVRRLALRGRRERRPEPAAVTIGHLVIDVAAGVALANGQPLALSALLLRLLAYLGERQGRVVERVELLRALWPAGARPNTVDVAMGRLERRLHGSSSGTTIRRVHGRGWVIS